MKNITFIIVDEGLCIGCGICVDACPMKILDIRDGLCILTDDVKCLECGTCMYECPKKALAIEERIRDTETTGEKSSVEVTGERAESKIEFKPVIEPLSKLLQELHPVQVYDCDGEDVTAFDDFEIEGHKSYGRVFRAEKVEKIGVSSMNFFGLMTANVISIRPAAEYDIPMFIMDWDESEDHIFFICDLIPSDDPGRNENYLTNYLYHYLEDHYQTYSTIPGLKNSVFHWVRAFSSPYVITGTIRKKFQKGVDMIFDCATDYLKAWIEIYKEAKPQDPQSAYMKLVHERRKAVGKQLRENDPGLGPLNKFLGKKKAQVAMSIVDL